MAGVEPPSVYSLINRDSAQFPFSEMRGKIKNPNGFQIEFFQYAWQWERYECAVLLNRVYAIDVSIPAQKLLEAPQIVIGAAQRLIDDADYFVGMLDKGEE